MSAFFITGGRALSGAVEVHGAKNSVLPILAATILSGGESVIHNCPRLTDVEASVAILRHLGCRVDWEGDVITVNSAPMCRWDVPEALMREMRSSVIFLGAILARAGRAELSMPGGCELGPRPIDLHLAALRRMGAEIKEAGGRLSCRCVRPLEGCDITLSIASVGATENAMLAACACRGITTIYNAAREPEIADLQAYLRAAGAKVDGAGSSTVVIQGGGALHDGEHRVIGDRIVAATYLATAASAGGDIAVRGVDYRQLSTVTGLFREAGCRISSTPEEIRLTQRGILKGVPPLRTAPYPGFPTDAQPPVMGALARSRGTTVFVENIFENRYRHVGELARMGASIRVEGRVAVVCGVERLHGAPVEAADLRGGAALLVAALGAEGETTLTGLAHLDRGYWGLDTSLQSLGAQVRRGE